MDQPTAQRFILQMLVAEAATLMQIRFVDHIIIGRSEGGSAPYFSKREAGMVS